MDSKQNKQIEKGKTWLIGLLICALGTMGVMWVNSQIKDSVNSQVEVQVPKEIKQVFQILIDGQKKNEANSFSRDSSLINQINKINCNGSEYDHKQDARINLILGL